MQVKGTGLANTCPVVESGSGPKALKAGDYKFDKFCVEPTSFTVKEEKADGSTEFAKTKLMTRLTYTLDAMSGDFKVGSDGSVKRRREGRHRLRADHGPIGWWRTCSVLVHLEGVASER